ncbi:Hypothetical predicted protein [Lecanosticta acicola]|uniref:Profilin n=1 Tax=Lecanosticta acicola TaxID=111012 RepID=A0AAI9E7S3_9PEZI|nr:Hypothetical predicted protein [Lecanosticta acicola]
MASLILLLVPFLSLVVLLLSRALGSRINRPKNGSAPDLQIDHCVEEKAPYRDIEPLEDFDWTSTPPIQNAPLKPKYHLTMALETISISDLIAMDNTYAARMKIRREIMRENLEAALQCNPVCEPAVLELYDWMVNTYLPTRFPAIYTRSEKGMFNTVNNEILPTSPPSALSALNTLGAHVDTDFLLLLPSSKAPDGSPIYHLEAFVACFPSGFSTRKKLGLPLAEIHSPVPGYRAKLEKSMDRFFARVEVGKVVKRSNWALTTDDRLFAEGGSHLYENGTTDGDVMESQESEIDLQADLQAQKDAVQVEDCRLRSERQVLFRLAKTKALVFATKTYQYRLEEVKEDGYGEVLHHTAYVDQSLVGTGNVDKAAIFSADGTGVWATSAGFTVTPQEMQEVVNAYKDKADVKQIQSTGIHIAGERYVVLKAEENSIYGKKGKEGVIIVKTQQAILVTHYPENVQPGNATNTVEQLGDYLKSVGY